MEHTLHIYRRVSTRGQEEKYSLDDQLKLGKKKMKSLGLKNLKDWCEGGKSGSSENIEDREVLTELFTEIQEGNVKYLYVLDLSRLSRNPMVSSILRKELEEKDVTLYTQESSVDFQSDEQLLMFDFFSSINQFFVRVQRKKSMTGKVSHFKKGGWRGGKPPFGYKTEKVNGTKSLVIDEEQSGWVRKIFDMFISDSSSIEICRELDKNKVQPPRSTTDFWNPTSVTNMLRNEIYIGTDSMIDKITDKNNPKRLYHTNPNLRIIDNYTFDLVQVKLDETLKKKNQLTKVKHDYVLLRGLIFCGDCGDIYGCRVKPSKNEYYYYCRSRENNWRKIDKSKKVKCGVKKSINIKNTDKIVWKTLIDILQNSHLIKEKIKVDILSQKTQSEEDKVSKLNDLYKEKRKVSKSIKDLEIREKDNRNWYLVGDVSKEQFDDGNKLIRGKKDTLFDELNNLNMRVQNIKDSNKWFDWIEKHKSWISNLRKNFSEEDKKEIVKEYIRKINVYFDHKLNQHKLILTLKLPIVNDKFVKNGKSKGGISKYNILNGESQIGTIVEPTKVGRKKKLTLDKIIEGGDEIPPIKNSQLQWNRRKNRLSLTLKNHRKILIFNI